ATDLPVIAIGGVDISNVEACRSAGASGVAVIRAVSDLGVLRERLLAAL
ncbi:MAG: thiamine phosphate synthase, partial [Candidatus Aeolococcus gillhamiae]